jgi:hypothetical protein
MHTRVYEYAYALRTRIPIRSRTMRASISICAHFPVCDYASARQRDFATTRLGYRAIGLRGIHATTRQGGCATTRQGDCATRRPRGHATRRLRDSAPAYICECARARVCVCLCVCVLRIAYCAGERVYTDHAWTAYTRVYAPCVGVNARMLYAARGYGRTRANTLYAGRCQLPAVSCTPSLYVVGCRR